MVAVAARLIDVSVAAKWFLRDEILLAQADTILTQFGAGTLSLVSPAYFHDEAANIFPTAVRRGRLSAEDARRQYAALLALDIVIVESTPARRIAALDLALSHDIAYYDAIYLQLAQELDLPLLTADQPLYARIAAAFPTTIYLGSL